MFGAGGYQCLRITVRILRFVARCRFAVREISGSGLNALLTCNVAVVKAQKPMNGTNSSVFISCT